MELIPVFQLLMKDEYSLYTNIYSDQTSNLTLTHDDLKAKERMVINNAGNVGIGTTSPGSGYKLDVNGNCNISGDTQLKNVEVSDKLTVTGYLQVDRSLNFWEN